MYMCICSSVWLLQVKYFPLFPFLGLYCKNEENIFFLFVQLPYQISLLILIVIYVSDFSLNTIYKMSTYLFQHWGFCHFLVVLQLLLLQNVLNSNNENKNLEINTVLRAWSLEHNCLTLNHNFTTCCFCVPGQVI